MAEVAAWGGLLVGKGFFHSAQHFGATVCVEVTHEFERLGHVFAVRRYGCSKQCFEFVVEADDVEAVTWAEAFECHQQARFCLGHGFTGHRA